MLEYITGEKKRPEIADADKLTPDETTMSKQWRTTNDRIITSLLNSMEPTVSDPFMMTETTHELCEAVKDMYGQQNNLSYIYQLMQDIQQEKQGSRSHTEYLSTLEKKNAMSSYPTGQ